MYLNLMKIEDEDDDDAAQVNDSIHSFPADEAGNEPVGDTDNICEDQASVSVSVSNDNDLVDEGVPEARQEKTTSKRFKSNKSI